MKKFNNTLDNFTLLIEQPLSNIPVEIFNILYEELVQKFNILTDYSQLEPVKRHLYSRIEQSSLDEYLKNYFQNAIKNIDNYPMLFIFLKQQIEGV